MSPRCHRPSAGSSVHTSGSDRARPIRHHMPLIRTAGPIAGALSALWPSGERVVLELRHEPRYVAVAAVAERVQRRRLVERRLGLLEPKSDIVLVHHTTKP